MTRAIVFATLLILACAVASHAATLVIVNQDLPGEGFNDPTPAAPVGGNPGTTVGQQRLNVFQYAADIWGARLSSPITIRVQAQFDVQTCTMTQAVLGSAGPVTRARDFPGAPFAATWYHIAQANSLNGSDLAPANNDINATFNSALDGNPACLNGTMWYYGFDGNEGTNIELLPVVLHEMAHGLGFSTAVNLATGGELSGFDDAYERFIRDNTTGLNWHTMTNAQRQASAINTGNVVWSGPITTALADNWLGGTPKMDVNSPVPPLPATMAIGTAAYGPSPPSSGITGDVVLVNDGVAPNSDACEPPILAVVGKIALIDRGVCTFVSKTLAAQDAGAIAVIIANNVAGPAPGLGGTDPGGLTIPTVSVSLTDGNAIKAQLGAGVNVTLRIDVNDLAGADGSNRVQLFAPNPVQAGSSISHFDDTALPNILMEPAINNNLSWNVDLTQAAFLDMGWSDIVTGVTDGPRPRSELAVLANYPNPFNPSTSIRYVVPDGQQVRVEIYDVEGRLVRSLVDRFEPAGTREAAWNGYDNDGRPVSSGIYFVRLSGKSDVATKKIVLVK